MSLTRFTNRLCKISFASYSTDLDLDSSMRAIARDLTAQCSKWDLHKKGSWRNPAWSANMQRTILLFLQSTRSSWTRWTSQDTGYPCSVGKTLCLAVVSFFCWTKGKTTSQQKLSNQSAHRWRIPQRPRLCHSGGSAMHLDKCTLIMTVARGEEQDSLHGQR